MYKIYKLTNILNGKFYIGYTKQELKNRFNQHCRESVLRKKTHLPIRRAILKYGRDNFIIECLHSFDNKDQAVNKEIELIEQEKPEYNAHKGGTGGQFFREENGMYGKKHSDQTREKMRISHIGEKNWMYGRTHSMEAREKIRQSSVGRKGYWKGKKIPEYIKKKMRKSKTEEHKNKLKKTFTIIDPNGNIVKFTGLTNFCEKNNLNPGAISEVANGKRQQYKGWRNICSVLR